MVLRRGVRRSKGWEVHPALEERMGGEGGFEKFAGIARDAACWRGKCVAFCLAKDQ